MTELRFKRQYVMLIIIILMMVSIFTQITSASSFGNSISQLTDYEKSILFNESGIYNSPPMVPGEVRKQLAAWELPDWEKTDSKEKLDSRTYSDGTVDLVNGWNLISIPKKLDPDHDEAEFVFSGVDTAYHPIYYYNASIQVWNQLYEDTEIKPLIGYFVYSVGQSSLNTMYTLQTNPSVELYPGWNIVGYFDPMGNYNDDYLHAAMARDELAVLGGNWGSAIGYDATTQQYEPTIIRGGSGIHSDFQLMYPEKGYWVYMYTDDTFAFSVTHTYTCSAEWIVDYPGVDRDCEPCDDEASGFYNSLDADTYWSGDTPGFINGNSNANEDHWKDTAYGGHDYDYIDETNFAYFSGHGGAGGIEFSDGISSSSLTYDEALWGNTKVDWIALAACNVLNESGIDNWKSRFKGLHSIVSWSTIGMAHPSFGSKFANYLKGDDTIWYSWQQAANDYVWEQNKYKVAILAVDTDGNFNTRECVDDHIYGNGIWYSPSGYNPVIYYDSVYCD
jgi:hypothetical protein